jgi:hypothetical protein
VARLQAEAYRKLVEISEQLQYLTKNGSEEGPELQEKWEEALRDYRQKFSEWGSVRH